MNYHEKELPGLAGIAAFIHWWEEFLNLVNGPVLLAGMFIALIDLLTDGKLTATQPLLLYVWAGSQALGIDGQLMGSWERVSRSHGWRLVGWLAVGVVLGFAAWQAGYVFAVQQSEGISEAAALAQLHMPTETWLGWRMFLAVGLVALAGLTRYRAPVKVAVSLEDERAKLERELTLEPMRQRLRAQQVGGWRSVAQTALGGAGVASDAQTGVSEVAALRSQESHHTATPEARQHAVLEGAESSIGADEPTKPPTGPGSPSLASKPAARQRTAAANVTPLRATRAARQTRRVAARANARSGKRGTAEKRVREVLAADPAIAFDELVKRADVSESTASKWQAVVQAERANTLSATQQQGGQYAQ